LVCAPPSFPEDQSPVIQIALFYPMSFFIYFRAAARESASYPAALRRRISGERAAAIFFQLSLLAALWIFDGWDGAFRLYLVPIFIVFPVAFALNRLGQHYNINPDDPAQWSTLMKPSWFWDFAYLWSNYHLEHHYFPGVPFYNLPKLRRLLEPFLREKGIQSHGYARLLYQYLILNKAPHSDWSRP